MLWGWYRNATGMVWGFCGDAKGDAIGDAIGDAMGIPTLLLSCLKMMLQSRAWGSQRQHRRAAQPTGMRLRGHQAPSQRVPLPTATLPSLHDHGGSPEKLSLSMAARSRAWYM